jgi:hypothetical protein
MGATVSVLVPTRKRLGFLGKMLRSFEATIGDAGSAELVFRCDADDAETIEFLRQRPYPFIVGPRVEGYKSLPGFYNEMAAVARGDLLMCCNDDVEFRTPGWPALLAKAAAQYPDGIFNFGVNVGLNDDKFPFSIVSRRLVQALGFINDERLLFSDVFLLDVARHFGRAIRLETVTIFHDWAGHASDETRRDANRHEFDMVFKDASGEWTDRYRELHDRAVAEAVAKIGRTRSGRSGAMLEAVDRYAPSRHRTTADWPPRVRCAAWNAPGQADGMPYARSEAAQLIDVVQQEGVNLGQAVVTAFGNGLPSWLWSRMFGEVISLRQGPAGEERMAGHTLMSGDPGDTRFLYAVLERLTDLHALIIDDPRYASAMSAYFLLGQRLKRPGIVVFTPAASDQSPGTGAARLVSDLRSGAVDNRRHAIADVAWEPGSRGLCYELLT